LRLSSGYHPHTDGQSERMNQSLKDLFKGCVLDDLISWVPSACSLPTKIVIMLVLEWRHMKLCIKGSLGHLYVSIMMVEYVNRT
jgi:hypothetical protein